MSKYLIAVLLVVPLLLASSQSASADNCCGGHAEKKATGEKSPEKVAPAVESKAAAVHGGMMTASGDYRIETVMRGREVRLYVCDSTGKPISTKSVKAKAWVVPAKGKKVAVTMKHVPVGKGRTRSYLAGTTDLDYGEDAAQKLSVSLSGLGEESKGTASFDVSVIASDTVAYQCPMHGSVKSADPGKCPDCGMALKRQVKKAVVAKDTSAEKTYTCPMHPEVVAKKAGDCPKCGMKLKMSAGGKSDGASEKKAAAESVYACPMHPDVKSNAPGKCSKCSMALRKVTPGKDSGKSGGGCGGCGG